MTKLNNFLFTFFVFIITFNVSSAQIKTKFDANMELAGKTLIHTWDEGAFQGAKYKMQFSSTNIEWEAIDGKPKGAKGNDIYQSKVLENNVKRVVWQESTTGYKLVLDYNFTDMVINGVIFANGNIFLLKSNKFEIQ
jgi:hypothetical protein